LKDPAVLLLFAEQQKVFENRITNEC
jgi:hypothetical protein